MDKYGRMIMKRLLVFLLSALICLTAAHAETDGTISRCSVREDGSVTAGGSPDRIGQIAVSLASGGKALTVGDDIAPRDILQFYWTYDASTYPPRFQRYRFCVEDGKHLFFHETREGDHWPLTEEDATVTGQLELSQDEWQDFLDCLAGGTAEQWEDPLSDGDAGPFLFLYWLGDGGVSHEFSFASREKAAAFEELCEVLKERETMPR